MLLFAPELFCTVPVPGQCCFYLFTLLLSQRSEEGWQSCVPQFVVATYIDFTYVLEVSPGIPSLHCAEELSAYRDLHTKHTKELLRSSLCGCSASFSSQLGAVGLVALALTHTSGCLQPCSLTGTDWQTKTVALQTSMWLAQQKWGIRRLWSHSSRLAGTFRIYSVGVFSVQQDEPLLLP